MRTWQAGLARLVVGAVAVLGLTALGPAEPASAASLQRVTNFGTNPSNLNMYVYVPDRVAARPAILVAVHYCTGSAQAFFSGMAQEYVTAADQYGYVIVFPEATRSGQCFDVYSPEALRRNGGSDPVAIKSMIDYALTTYNGDPNRVFVTGASSGAMMTNVLMGLYPDVIKAGVAFMGVPFGCFATGSASSTWNSQCSGGQTTKTAQQWGDQVRQAYPGYSGSYPRMQAWHGSTDTTLSYNNFAEEIKQWTNLHSVSQTPALTDSPKSGWTRTRYGNSGVQPPVEGISVQGVGHSLPTSGMISYAIAFLGLNATVTATPAVPTTTPASTITIVPTTWPVTPTTSVASTTSSASGGSSGCVATYTTASSWTGGFVGSITVTAGSATVSSWRVAVRTPSGVITNAWNGTLSGSGSSYTLANAGWNNRLAAGQSTTAGFQATGSPADVTVSCTAG
jgi:poly(hydroxyalkanoate) depolymerase family esterase